uniref:Si:dkey-35i13.1 n=1 Tax=Salarias fasciatus TaxID=181472 RepID=A0A672HK32_SALFA
MTARTAEASGLSVPVHRCHGARTNGTATCAEQLSIFPPFSSTLALLVLVVVLVGIILVSLATFHFHKRKLRNRKIQRAQEEYERDSRSPARAGGGEPARPCVIVRPVRRAEEEHILHKVLSSSMQDDSFRCSYALRIYFFKDSRILALIEYFHFGVFIMYSLTCNKWRILPTGACD